MQLYATMAPTNFAIRSLGAATYAAESQICQVTLQPALRKAWLQPRAITLNHFGAAFATKPARTEAPAIVLRNETFPHLPPSSK